MKIRLVGAELLHADRRMELIGAFRNFSNAPKADKRTICTDQSTVYYVSVTLLTVGVDKDPPPPDPTARGTPKYMEHQHLLWGFFRTVFCSDSSQYCGSPL